MKTKLLKRFRKRYDYYFTSETCEIYSTLFGEYVYIKYMFLFDKKDSFTVKINRSNLLEYITAYNIYLKYLYKQRRKNIKKRKNKIEFYKQKNKQ